MATNPPTLEDVAKLAGFSAATVSRFLNTPEKLSPKARAAIDEAISALNYVPNFGGRALASNQTNIVGAIVPSLSNAMFANGLQAVERTLTAAGRTLLVATSDYDPEQELRHIRSLLAHGASAILLIGKIRDPRTQALLDSHKIPHVIAWTYEVSPRQTFIGFDNVAAARAAAEQVLNYGHRHIGIIAGICETNDRAQDRKQGFCEAIERHGQARLTHCREAHYTLEEGRLAFDALYAKAPETTAILCGNDVLAAGAMIAAREKSLKIPEQISILGFDDIGLARVTTPPLTTVRVPQNQMGQLAAKALIEMQTNSMPTQSIELNTEFILRGTLVQKP